MNLAARLLDVIYPPRCPLCGVFRGQTPEREGTVFCAGCVGGFRENTPPLCPLCGKPFASDTGEDHWCESCMRKRPVFDALAAPYVFEGGIMDAIHQFKYGQKTHVGDSLGRLLAAFSDTWAGGGAAPLVLPVPLHPRRLRERGFNQSLMLARHVAARVGAELDFLNLRRFRYTAPQTSLGRDERRKNVRNAFGLMEEAAVRKRSVLLIDDVATTGNTLNECARVLKRAGCESVRCLVVARAVDR